MKTSRVIVVYTTFNQWLPHKAKYESMGITHPALTPKWIVSRFKTWKATACRSILRQQRHPVFYVVMCHHRSRDLCQMLFAGIDPRIIIVYTDAECREWMTRTLVRYDEILAVRLDSDDMYAPNMARQVAAWAATSKAEFAYWPRGYAYDHERKQLWKYECKGSGPFYVHRWKRDALLAHGRIKDKYCHGTIRKLGAVPLPGRRFCVTVNHGLNDSTRYNAKRFRTTVLGPVKTTILSTFGVQP